MSRKDLHPSRLLNHANTCSFTFPVVTNHPEHDPDIQHVPFFAITPKFFDNLYSTYYRRTMLFDAASRFFVSIQ